MSKLKEDKKISRGESDFHYSKNIICCKWYNNKPVLRLVTNADDISGVSNVIRRSKVSVTKTPVSCPSIIKLYNNGIGGVDIAQQTFAGLEDVLKTSSTRLRLQHVFKKYLQDVFKTPWKTKNCYAEDVLKTSWR